MPLFFGGGLSGLQPMPMRGTLSPAAAALRTYELTLHDARRGGGGVRCARDQKSVSAALNVALGRMTSSALALSTT